MRTFPTRVQEAPGQMRPLRIGVIAPPVLPLPPPMYAGTERIVSSLVLGLHEREHHVTVFAPGDSELPCEVVPIVRRALWSDGYMDDASLYHQIAVAKAWEMADRFDVIHSHVDTHGFLFAAHSPVPVVTTLHRRLDVGGAADYIDVLSTIPLVAISESQRRWNPDANWVATIHHGLDFSSTPHGTRPGDYLLLVGRVSREKGVEEAIELAQRTRRRLVIAAKAHHPDERALLESAVRPAIEAGIVEWRGEVDSATRDRLMVDALATVMLGAWPEPFGLVAIESMATGTPVIGRRAGALTETIRHGLNGFLVDDLDEAALAVSRVGKLDRAAIARSTRERFAVDRMVDGYESVYRRLVEPDTDQAPVDVAQHTRRAGSSERDTLIAVSTT